MQLFILKFNKDEWAPKLLQYDTGKTAQLIIHEELLYEFYDFFFFMTCSDYFFLNYYRVWKWQISAHQ